MTHKEFDVIVSGHVCVDLFPTMDNITREMMAMPGRLMEVGPLSLAPGGAVSNTGQALRQLGVKVRLMATVGDDLISSITVALLKQRDPAQADLITSLPGQSASYTIVLSPARADRIFLHCAGFNHTFGVANIDFSAVAQARVFYLGYPSILPRTTANDGAELAEIYRRAKAAGAVTALDMSLPDPQSENGRLNWPAILKNALPHVHIFIPSIEEIVFMLRRRDYDAWQGIVLPHLDRAYLADLAAELSAMGSKIVGFKLGEMGMYLRTAADDLPPEWSGVEYWLPAYQVDVVGTTGAGDAAYAGFLAAWLRGLPPESCLRWACAVGACNVEAVDATSGIRTWEATETRMASGWPPRPERLKGF